MKEMFVPFKVLEKLKAKGYPIPKNVLFGLYDDDKFIQAVKLEWDFLRSKLYAPTIEQVLTWLRKEKKLHIACLFYKDEGYYYYVYDLGSLARIYSSFDDSDDCFSSYEEAALAGIEYVIDRIIF